MVMSQTHKTVTRPRGSLVAALDIGSAKVTCFIARIRAAGPEIVGIGHHESRGMKSGTITDMNALRAAIGHAVQAAEDMAGDTISQVIVGLPGVMTRSHRLTAETAVAGNEVSPREIQALLAHCCSVEETQDSPLIHAIATEYQLDAQSGIRNPAGMFGARLHASLHAVTAQGNHLRNLQNAILENHLEVDILCDSSYAAALAVLVAPCTTRFGC